MESIRIIKNKDELEGTGYVELLAGPYLKKCWIDGSLFFDEETFGYIEPAIERRVPEYDHYSFTEISMESWGAIVGDLKAVRALLQRANSVADLGGAVGFIFSGSEERFADGFVENKAALCHMIAEVSAWIEETARTHDSVTVLGI